MAALRQTPGRIDLLEQVAAGRVVARAPGSATVYLLDATGLSRQRVTDRARPLARAGWIAVPVVGTRYRLTDVGAEIRRAAAPLPDLGAFRAAELLAERFGIEVPTHTVPELARLGLVPRVGWYKDNALYSGFALAAFADRQVLVDAARDGELFTSDEAAARLRIRRVDLDHLVRAGLLAASDYAHSRFQRRRESPAVALYRAGDLDDVTHRADIDWDAVRATPPGHRSALAQLRDGRPR